MESRRSLSDSPWFAMTAGDLIVRLTAGMTVGLYLVACLCLARDGRESRGAKWWWTAGWVMLVVHTGAAFHFRHDWSHALATEHVARRTEEVVGFYWAGGIWFNHALLAAWTVDIVLMWTASRRGWWTIFVHTFLAMMILSATVVFGPAYWWIAAVAFAAAMLIVRANNPRN